MKIHPNPDLRSVAPTAPKRLDGPGGPADFSAILKETVGRTEAPEQAAAVGGAGPTFSAAPIQRVAPSQAAASRALVDRLDHLVNLLDDYRRLLADPGVSLKQIAPLLNRIAAEKDGLQPEMENLAAGDELRKIMNSTLVMASLEVVRFNRGEYLDPA